MEPAAAFADQMEAHLRLLPQLWGGIMQLACSIHSAHHHAARDTQLTAYIHAADGLIAAVEATLNNKVWRHHELPTTTLNLGVKQGKVSCNRGAEGTAVSVQGQCNTFLAVKQIDGSATSQ